MQTTIPARDLPYNPRFTPVVWLLLLMAMVACGGEATEIPAAPTATPAATATQIPATAGPAATQGAAATEAATATQIPATVGPTATQGATATEAPTSTVVPGAHEGSEGLVLGSEQSESVYRGARCTDDAPVREYRVAGINVQISLNRFLDYDPLGRMYVLEENLNQVRDEEAQNRAARMDQAEPAVTIAALSGVSPRPTSRTKPASCGAAK